MDSEPGERAAVSRRDRVPRAVVVGLAVVLLGAFALTLADADGSAFAHWTGTPPWRAIAGAVLFAVVVGWPGRASPARRAAACACLLAVWSTCRVLTMGDGYWW